MKKVICILGMCVLCFAWLGAQQRQARPLTEEEQYLESMHRHITSEKLFNYVVEFADSSYQGRLVGTKAMAQAVERLSHYFAEFGLEPGGDNGSYVQEYANPTVEIGYGSGMSILFPIQERRNTVWLEKTYPWADGWFAGNYSGNGDVTAEVVYAGFGVSAPELGYDDYKGIDVRGKIVLIEGETPNRSREPEDIAKWYKHTLHQTKLQTAAEKGAVGLLYKWVPGPNAVYNPGLVYCHITEPVVEDIFLGTGRTYKETVAQIYETKKPASFATGKKARIHMNATYLPNATGKNVLGVIRGSDPKLADEYIVLSAHLDHLGMIPYHIAGANDNLSCTAAMLGVAEALMKAGIRPKRSIIIFSVDGEEAGLTGSTHFAANPTVPKEKIRAILNLEQLGAGSGFGANCAYNFPELGKYVQEANDRYVHRRLNLSTTTYLPRPRTDGAVFMKAGYPCIDLRATGGSGYYHHPLDDVDSILPESLQAAAEWLYWSLILLANDESL